MDTTGVFVDLSNLYYNIRKKFNGRKVNYSKYLQHIQPAATIFKACGSSRANSNTFKSRLVALGFDVTFLEPSNQKLSYCTIHLMLEILKTLDSIQHIVIGSSDRNLIPFIDYLKSKGKNIIIFACNIPTELSNLSNSHYEIDESELEDATTNRPKT
jgi:hypothetical protein